MLSIWKTLLALFKVMPRGSRRFYVFYSIVTSCLSAIDIAALALIATIVSSLTGDNNVSIPLVGSVPQSQILWLILLVGALFIGKSALALAMFWWATRRFARYELEVGDRLFRTYAKSDWASRSRLSTAEVSRLVDSSMAIANSGFILQLTQIPGFVFTFIAVVVLLFFTQPLTALLALVYLLVVFMVLSAAVFRRSKRAGALDRLYSYRVATLITEMVDTLKELTLRDKLDEIGVLVSKNRHVAARARANVTFASTVPRYVFEAALIGGFLFVGGVTYFMSGIAATILAVSLFAATGFRMIPALYGIQTSIASAAAYQIYAQDVIREVGAHDEQSPNKTRLPDVSKMPSRPGQLQLKELSFRYPNSSSEALKKVTLTIPFGSSLGIVGPSGSGKSTLIDLILGLSVPTSGQILVDNIPLREVLGQWQRKVGFVPQRVALFNGSLAQNIALTWAEEFDTERVELAIKRAHLDDLVLQEKSLSSPIGERGALISGGQQQRLGIARALYTEPLVLVMDEATSSLDTETENRVVQSIRELRGQVTFITVAHRLATIREYDQICYIDHGELVSFGTFEEVVEAVPDFRKQAQLAGLVSW